MRYHWGLGIGHTYSHGRDVHSQQYSAPTSAQDPEVTQPKTPPDGSQRTHANLEKPNTEEEPEHEIELDDSEAEHQIVAPEILCDGSPKISADLELPNVEEKQEEEMEPHDSGAGHRDGDLDSHSEDSGSASDDESDMSQSDDQENDEDFLEMYETYHSD